MKRDNFALSKQYKQILNNVWSKHKTAFILDDYIKFTPFNELIEGKWQYSATAVTYTSQDKIVYDLRNTVHEGVTVSVYYSSGNNKLTGIFNIEMKPEYTKKIFQIFQALKSYGY